MGLHLGEDREKEPVKSEQVAVAVKRDPSYECYGQGDSKKIDVRGNSLKERHGYLVGPFFLSGGQQNLDGRCDYARP